jgi:hypothetical protein
VVLGSNLETSAGPHDAFGLAEPEATRVAATFTDGTSAEGRVESGTFVVAWSGPKTLIKLAAFAGDRDLTECSPMGQYLSLNSNDDKSTASFACRV